MKTSHSIIYGTLVILLLLAQSTSANAATVVWNTASTISGDSDVSTTGTLLQAFSLGEPLSPVVNGVTFNGQYVNTTGSTTFGSGEGALIWDDTASGGSGNATVFGATTTPYSSLSDDYKTLLSTASYNSTQNSTPTLIFNGLVVGREYQVQFWSNDSRDSFITAGRSTILTATNAVTLDQNTTDSDGGLGQFVTGVFTADNTSQSIVTSGLNGNVAINGFQIRAIPEPSTCFLMGIGVVGLFLLRHSGRRVQRSSVHDQQ